MPKPTIEQMKQALRVAEEAMQIHTSLPFNYNEAKKFVGIETWLGPTKGLKDRVIKEALTQISPILEEMEESK